MPKPRLPALKAKVIGAAARSPGRFKKRSNPKTAALGGPPVHLDVFAKRAWNRFRAELPWLVSSDAAVLEIAAIVRGKLLSGDVPGITALNMYQSVLSKLGATPADRSKVDVPDDEEADEFFGTC
ncbi:hypothetical protein U1839_06135 [Sphingomonas sp. RT2P30]